MYATFWTLGACLLVAAPRGGHAELMAVREAVLPTRPETWETIPWRTDLEAARREAAREGRLLFLWAMNGHPCGST